MSNKKLVLIIDAHQAFLRNIEKDSNFTAQNNVLFSAITGTYIPLLNMFARLEAENIPFKYEGGITAFMEAEVKPYAPDAYLDESKTKIGYEISFTKYF